MCVARLVRSIGILKKILFFTFVLFFYITMVNGFMVVKTFTDMELYLFSVHFLFVGGSMFQLPSSGEHKFTLISAQD